MENPILQLYAPGTLVQIGPETDKVQGMVVQSSIQGIDCHIMYQVAYWNRGQRLLEWFDDIEIHSIHKTDKNILQIGFR